MLSEKLMLGFDLRAKGVCVSAREKRQLVRCHVRDEVLSEEDDVARARAVEMSTKTPFLHNSYTDLIHLPSPFVEFHIPA